MIVDIKIIDTHDKIINIIRDPISCLINFDWHADYPRYAKEIIDIDQYILQIDPVWFEQNWIAILASYGLVKEFTWIFPHDYGEEDIKVFESKSGDSIIFNKKFDKDMKIECPYITIDMDFFGSRSPINWSPKDKKELLKDVLNTLKAKEITLIISKTENWVNYDVDKFLQYMLTEILCKHDIYDIE